jgi:hypothetical protein
MSSAWHITIKPAAGKICPNAKDEDATTTAAKHAWKTFDEDGILPFFLGSLVVLC